MTSMTDTPVDTRRSRRHATGLVLAGVLSASNILSALGPAPADGEPGPPVTILVLGSALGLIGLVAVVHAWRSGSRRSLRVAAGTLVLVALTAVPAFFVDVPVVIKLLVALQVLVTILTVVLMFSPDRRPAPVTD